MAPSGNMEVYLVMFWNNPQNVKGEAHEEGF